VCSFRESETCTRNISHAPKRASSRHGEVVANMQVGVPEELCGSWAIGKKGLCFACGCGKRGATPFQKCLMQIWSTISCHFLAWWLWCFRHVSWKCQEDRNKARIELQGIIQHHFPGAHTLGRWCLDAVRLFTSKKVMKQTCRGWLLYSSQCVLPRPSRTSQIWKIVFFKVLKNPVLRSKPQLFPLGLPFCCDSWSCI